MRRLFLRIVSGGAVLLLMGCTTSVASILVPQPRIDVPELDVRFAYPEPLTVRMSENEGLLAGTQTTMQVQTLPYAEAREQDDKSGVLHWAIPSEIAKAVFAERSCGPLKSKRVFLPVDTTLPMRCDLVLDPSGRSIVWMVGLGRPFEAATFLQSSFLVLDDEQYHVFSYVFPFPEADATAQWLAETFPDRHPNMSTLIWPNRSFHIHMEEVQQTLIQQIDPSSQEVQDVMAKLKTLAFSVDRSQAAPAQ